MNSNFILDINKIEREKNKLKLPWFKFLRPGVKKSKSCGGAKKN